MEVNKWENVSEKLFFSRLLNIQIDGEAGWCNHLKYIIIGTITRDVYINIMNCHKQYAAYVRDICEILWKRKLQ